VKSEASRSPWRSLVPVNLPPFALWTAFPSSDYYGGSVALRLAPVRRSRISCSSDIQDGSRCPVRVLQAPDGSPASVERVQSGAANPVRVSRSPPGILEAPDVSHRFRSAFFPNWTPGFKRSSLHHTVRASTGEPLGGFAVPGFSEHANFPLDFRRQVGPVAQGYHAQPFPSGSGINSSRDAAHRC